MKKSFFTIFALVLGLGLVAAACNHSDDSSTTTTVAPETTAAPTTSTTTRATTTTTPAPTTYTLTILHNNDGESKLLPNADRGFPGIARFVTALQNVKEDAINESNGVITLTSGDNFLASKELSISLDNPDGPFYDALALSGLYDAMALGNHDFDFGPDVTARFISSFDPAIPFLSANTDVSNEPVLKALQDEGRLAGSVEFTKDGRKIGVIGAITESLPSISTPRRAVIGNVFEAIQREADALTADGVDIIIVVSHLQGIDEEKALTARLKNVDVVIAGGGDELVRNPGDTCLAGTDEEPESDVYPIVVKDADDNDVLVVTGPGGYRCLGRLNVTFDDSGIAQSWNGEAMGIAVDGEVDDNTKSQIEDPISAGVASLDTTILGTSSFDLDGRRSSVRTKQTNVGSLLADAFIWSSQQRANQAGFAIPDVAVTNGGGIRNDSIIQSGQITASDTFDIAPFGNRLVIMELTHQQLKDLMETTIEGAPSAAGGFAQVAGMSITYDLGRPKRGIDRDNDCVVSDAGERVRELRLNNGTTVVSQGQVSTPDAKVTLVITDFLANGGDCYPLGDIDFTHVGVTYQQSLAEYIQHANGLNGRISDATKYGVGLTNRIQVISPPLL